MIAVSGTDDQSASQKPTMLIVDFTTAGKQLESNTDTSVHVENVDVNNTETQPSHTDGLANMAIAAATLPKQSPAVDVGRTSGQLDFKSSNNSPDRRPTFEEAIKITGRRGRQPKVQYRVLFQDQTESWVQADNVGPGLLRDYRLQAGRQRQAWQPASKRSNTRQKYSTGGMQ
jgi:hypothetical protein